MPWVFNLVYCFMRRHTITITLIAIVIIIILGVFTWHHQQQSPKPLLALTPVKLVAAKKMNVPVVANAIGNLVAPQNVLITAQIAGEVDTIAFEDGQQVKQGQLLVRLNDTKQKAELAKAQSTLWKTQSQYRRYVQLSEQDKGFVTQVSLDDAISQYQQAQADAQSAKRDIVLMNITAPFKGILGVAQVAKGSFVKVGDPIVKIVNRQNLQLEYALPEADFRLVKLGQHVSITAAAYPNKIFNAMVDYVAPTVDETTRAFTIRARVNNQDNLLSPGMLVHVSHPLVLDNELIVIPAIAVVPLVDGFAVYLVRDGKVYQQHVTLAERYQSWVVVSTGLKVGDKVIASGNAKAKLGSKAKVVH